MEGFSGKVRAREAKTRWQNIYWGQCGIRKQWLFFCFVPEYPLVLLLFFCFNVVAVFKAAFVYSILATPAWHTLTWEECTISAAILVGMGLAAWYNFRRRGSVTLVSQVWHERVLHRDSTKTRMGQGCVKELGDCDGGEDIQFSFLFALSNRHLRNGLVTGVCLQIVVTTVLKNISLKIRLYYETLYYFTGDISTTRLS